MGVAIAERRRTVAFHAITIAVTVVACAAIAGLWLVYEGTKLPRIPVRITGDWLIEGDPEIGFVPVRNGSTEMRHLDTGLDYHLYTDERRARVNAPGAQTPDHVDVATVGCSFTWGTGVESEETWTQQLGRILGTSVANFGMGSYGSVQAFQMMVRHADLKPRVVVYGFIQDHLRRNVSPCAPNYVPYCLPVSYLKRDGDWIVLQPPHMEYFSPDDNRAFLTEVVMREPRGPRDWFLGAKWALRMRRFQYRNAATVAVDEAVETRRMAIRAMIGAMATEAQAEGARLVVLNMPFLPRDNGQPIPDSLLNALVGRDDVTLVDFGPVAAEFYATHPTGTLTNGDDPHPSPATHRMIAETLAPVVRAMLDR
jgi:hypothetical protein